MSRIKNQHFVPQFYLKNFSKAGQIFVYDKVVKKTFTSQVDSIACDKYFYDDNKLNEYLGDQIIEKTFSEFEGEVAPIISGVVERIKSESFKGFESGEKEALSEFLFYQMLRTREHRIEHEQLYFLMREELLERGFSEDQMREQGFDKKFDSKKEHLKMLLSTDRVSEILVEFCNRIWILVVNDSKYEFLTSDDPVIRYTHDKRGHLGYELFLPLTPRCGVMVLVRQAFRDFESFENQLMPFLDKQWVKWYNHLQVIQSTRQVYSIDSNLSFVANLVNDYPSIGEENRLRVTSMFKK